MSEEKDAKEPNGLDVEAELSEEDAAAAAKKKKKKKLIIILGVILLAGGVGAGLFFTGIIGKKAEHANIENPEEAGEKDPHAETKSDPHADPHAKAETKTTEDNQSLYLDMEDFIVNLNSEDGKPSFLKMAIALHVKGAKDAFEVKANFPVIRDTFQIYLRELRPEDLRGSSGVYRLKEELLLRVNKSLYPVKVTDILFKEILVQ